MKNGFRICSLLICLCLLIPGIAYAEEEMQFSCGTDPALMQEMYSELINQKVSKINAELDLKSDNRGILRSKYIRYDAGKRMPSTGNVRILVLPIEFPDGKMNQEIYESLEKWFFGEEENDAEKPLNQLSVRGRYKRWSYGKLDITGDILPLYTASKNFDEYQDTRQVYEEITEALDSYEDINYDDYDSDNSGYVDCLFVVHSQPHSSPVWHNYVIAGTIEPANANGKKFYYVGQADPSRYLENMCNATSVFAHEIAHMMGLPDNYLPDGTQCFLEKNLDELTGGSRANTHAGRYINILHRYLLDWIDPEVITYENYQLDNIELSAVEDTDTDRNKAVVLIPDPTKFPFDEFYMAEYRTGGVEDVYTINPGILLWHCDTGIDRDNMYKNEYRYVKPVYKSNSNGPFDIENDMYRINDEWSANTTPSSDFYEKGYTGAYMKVLSIDDKKAVIEAGYKNPDMTPAPAVTVEPASRRYINQFESARWYYSISSYDEVLTDSVEYIATGTVSDYWKVRNDKEQYRAVNYPKGDGTLQVKFNPGFARRGFRYSEAVFSDIVIVDNTRPVITVNGPASITLRKGEKYIELGATVTDNLDPEIQTSLTIDSHAVDTSKPGIYHVCYDAQDQAENRAFSVYRTVRVEAVDCNHVDCTSEILTESTCTAEGERRLTCQNCAETWIEKIPPLPHTEMVDPAVESTCETKGKTEGSHCLVCGYIIKPQVIVPILGHHYSGEWIKNETNHWHKCERCDSIGDVAAHLEDSGTVTKQPTLEEEGEKTFCCAVCGCMLRVENISKLEPEHTHSYNSEWKTDTETHWHECICGDKSNQKNHIVVIDEKVSATCETEGKTEGSHCSVCGYIIKPQMIVPMLGHHYSVEWIKDETNHWHKCERCDSVSEVTSHSYGEWVVVKDATATEKGSKERFCVTCGSKQVQEIPATGNTGASGGGAAGGGSGGGSGADFNAPPVGEKPTEDQNEGNLENTEQTADALIRFVDIKNHWAERPITYVVENDWMNGTSKSCFSPDEKLTRGMVVTVLHHMEKNPTAKEIADFVDVESGSYYAKAVSWAAERGIVKGYGNGRFCPNNFITREEFATILWTYAGSPAYVSTETLDRFVDGNKADNYSLNALRWAVEQKLMSGKPGSLLDPKGNMTRAEAAAMLWQFGTTTKK